MAEEVKDGASAPAEPVHTPLSEIVDKPRLQTDTSPVVDPPRQAALVERPERKPKADKHDDDARFRGLLNETLSEREKRQAVERERQAIEQERDQYKRAWEEHQRKLAADQDRDPAPDMFRDPQGYNAWVERQVDKRADAKAEQKFAPMREQTAAMQLRLSEMTAKEHLGPDKWKKLNAWIEGQPEQFKAWAMGQPDPYFAAYDQYRRRTTFERLGDKDIDTLIEEEVAKRLAAKAGPIDPPEDDLDEDERDYDAPRQRAPRSFAGARSADPTRDTAGRFTGPRPLGELVAERQNTKRKR